MTKSIGRIQFDNTGRKMTIDDESAAAIAKFHAQMSELKDLMVREMFNRGFTTKATYAALNDPNPIRLNEIQRDFLRFEDDRVAEEESHDQHQHEEYLFHEKHKWINSKGLLALMRRGMNT